MTPEIVRDAMIFAARASTEGMKIDVELATWLGTDRHRVIAFANAQAAWRLYVKTAHFNSTTK